MIPTPFTSEIIAELTQEKIVTYLSEVLSMASQVMKESAPLIQIKKD
jgi:hypothetical protein